MEEIKNDIQETQIIEMEETQLAEKGVDFAVGNVKGKIVRGALTKVDNKGSIDKHADRLAKIADDALNADIEKENIKVQRTHAENKAEKQEIKNKLIALKAEAKRLKREQKQVLKEQRADHKKRNKDMLWSMYEKKLTKMGYGYVPNIVILKMLFCIDGIVSCFDGIGKISTAIMKAIKWFLIAGAIFGCLMIFPATKEWVLGILGFIG